MGVAGAVDLRILWLTAAVTFWTGGFDVIYSCQDYEFDGAAGLFSLPRRFGIAGALRIARLFHLTMIGCLVALAWSFGLAWLSLAGIRPAIALLPHVHTPANADQLPLVPT